MSYILDALRKAESERRQDAVPTIHAQPPRPSLDQHRPSLRERPWVWVAVAALAVTAIGWAWRQPWQAGNATRPIAPVPGEVPAPRPMVPVTTGAPATPVAPVMQTPEDAPRLPAAPAARHAKPKPKRDLAQAPAKEPSPAFRPQSASTPVAAPPSHENIATIAELPAQIQREIPTLAIGGYLYAEKPAERTVLINKRLLHEGDQAAPDLVIERMMPNGMVLNYKGYRYRRSYY